ncbi:AAA domain protein, partial [Vibrio parahaemolyticus AQ3810]
GEVAD